MGYGPRIAIALFVLFALALSVRAGLTPASAAGAQPAKTMPTICDETCTGPPSSTKTTKPCGFTCLTSPPTTPTTVRPCTTAGDGGPDCRLPCTTSELGCVKRTTTTLQTTPPTQPATTVPPTTATTVAPTVTTKPAPPTTKPAHVTATTSPPITAAPATTATSATSTTSTPTTSTTTPPTTVASTPPPATSVTRFLGLDHSSTPPGGPVTATGQGCNPGSTVELSIGSVSVGSAVAGSDGSFRTPISVNLPVGHFQVVAVCGPTLQATLDVVLTSNAGPPTSTAALLLIILLMMLLTTKWQLSRK